MADSAMLIQWVAWIICISITAFAMLKGWNGWLELKRMELKGDPTMDADSPAGRISIADLKQRVRRLEAIADGIDIPDARQSGR